MELLRMLSTSEIVAQILNFLILFFLLRAFAWKPVLGLLDARREKIASDLASVEKAKSDVEQLKRAYESKIASIEEEAKARIQEAAVRGQALADEMKKNAYAEAQRIIHDARSDIQREVSVAREKMKEEIADLVIEAAGALFEEKLCSEDDKRFVRRFVDGIDALKVKR